MELYNLNGTMIRLESITSEFTEVELEFRWAKHEDRLLYALCTYYLALQSDQKVDFVFNDHTRHRIVVRTNALTEEVQKRLIAAVTITLEEASTLFGLSKRLFQGNPNKGIVDSNTDETLESYKVAPFTGRELVEAFESAIGWKLKYIEKPITKNKRH